MLELAFGVNLHFLIMRNTKKFHFQEMFNDSYYFKNLGICFFFFSVLLFLPTLISAQICLPASASQNADICDGEMARIDVLGLDPDGIYSCLLYTSPSPRDATLSRMPSSA